MQIRSKNNLIILALASLLAIMPYHAGVVSIPFPQHTPLQTSDTNKNRELQCLAKNIYFESRGEPFHGKVAVAQVTVNRVQHETNFKSTICGVVYESKQFSWTLESPKSIKDKQAWEESLAIAKAVISGRLRIPDFDALYFHTKQVKPKWRKAKRIVKIIGNHIFYA